MLELCMLLTYNCVKPFKHFPFQLIFPQFLALLNENDYLLSNSSSEGKIGFLVINFNIGFIPSGIIGKFGGNSGKDEASLKIVLR